VSVGIYAIKNKIDGNVYIGQSHNIERRFIDHKHRLNHNFHANRYLQSAWNEYGAENFDFIIIQNCADDDLTAAEQYWIDEYGGIESTQIYNLKDADSIGSHCIETRDRISESLRQMYLIHPCKNLGRNHSDETRKKMSESRKGLKHSEETKRKISESNKGKVIPRAQCELLSKLRTGAIMSDETKHKISESSKGRMVSDITRNKLSAAKIGKTVTDVAKAKISKKNTKYRVIQRNVQTGTVLNVFDSPIEAAVWLIDNGYCDKSKESCRNTLYSTKTHRAKHHNAYGFNWEYIQKDLTAEEFNALTLI